jgi:glycosyltransferase involved in cell wall biosynthesis
MPHIAVNARLLLPDRVEGIARFAHEVLQRMVRAHPEAQFSFFFDRPWDARFIFGPNVRPYALPPQARHPLLWHAWFHGTLPFMLRRLKPDLFFSPEFYLTNHTRIPQVPVFHDLAYEHYPEDIGKWAAHYCRKYSPIYARRAAQVLTVSQFSRQDLIDRYDLPPGKISVVYNGVSAGFTPLSEAEQAVVRARYTDSAPYFLFVGTLQPRKNLPRLLRAFARFKAAQPSPVKLVLAGRWGWKHEAIRETYEQLDCKEAVVLTGFVPEEELPSLYASALALCYVPYFEGFGIPLLEAMHSETAVISSAVSSMPEVAGEAALLVDPFSEAAIAGAMAQVYRDPGLRKRLIQAGRQQRERFSWDATYEKVWAVLESFL